jgi:elongation factor G
MCFVNKMDRVGADFFRTVEMVSDRLGAIPAVIQLPIGSENLFLGVIDLVQMKAMTWPEDAKLGERYDLVDIPAEYAEEAAEWREKLLEVVSSEDDGVMEKFLDGEEVGVDELKAALRKGTVSGAYTPVLCGSAFKNKGVQPMLDAVVDYLPSPLDVPPAVGHSVKDPEVAVNRAVSDDEPFAALAFKVMSDQHMGKLTFLRVYSGRIAKGAAVLNATKGKKERIGRILQMHAIKKEDRDEALTGDIVAVVGMKDTRTGDTLCDEKNPVVLESLDFPDPVISVAVEPKSKDAQDKLSKALQSLSDEDPSFRAYTDEETGQTIIGGQGELHLDIIVDRMRREFSVEANVGKPQVAYRETITNIVEKVEMRYVRQTGGKGQYGHVVLSLEPTGPGGGYQFVDKITGGVVPREYIPAVDAGIQDAMQSGVVAGYQMVDIRALLTYGSYHEVDSSEMAFKIAGSMCFKEAARRAKPVLLEPIMTVTVTSPEQFLGDVIGNLSSRRGKVEGMEQVGNAQVVKAQVPLSEMFGYTTDLRSMTQGRASSIMMFHSYQQVPESIAKEIVARVQGT